MTEAHLHPTLSLTQFVIYKVIGFVHFRLEYNLNPTPNRNLDPNRNRNSYHYPNPNPPIIDELLKGALCAILRPGRVALKESDKIDSKIGPVHS